jgi:hypothetical protein
MSNNNSTELTAWTREVRSLHTELARPIEVVSDPRLRALHESWPTFSGDDWAPAELGTYYFGKIGVQQLPAPPIARPEWAETHTFYTDDWPNTIGVEFHGRKWDTGDGAQWARLTAHYFIAIDGYTEGDETREPDDVWGGDVRVEFCYPEPFRADGTTKQQLAYTTLDGAFSLEVALSDALHPLRVSS